MSDEIPNFDLQALEAMNQKAIENQFFTPDSVYLELGLFKDFSIGAVYTDLIAIKDDEATFGEIQEKLLKILPDYQKRYYETVHPYFDALGYTDADVDKLVNNPALHDYIFIMSPNTTFVETLVRHTARNQNHSKPAHKFKKKSIDSQHYILEPMDITYRINTFPLSLSSVILERMGKEFGEALGVNIVFMNKDPKTFDQTDWDTWMEKMDCFYFDSLGRFTRSPFVIKKQEAMQFAGCYFFARKRFEREVIPIMRTEDFDNQVQLVTAQLGFLCDFEWLQNNEVRLTAEAENVPMMDDDQTQPTSDATDFSGN